MLNYKKYIGGIKKTEVLDINCPHCGMPTRSLKGTSVFCNFCEQYINISEAEIVKETGADLPFSEVSDAISSGRFEEAEKKLALFKKGKANPLLMYLSGLSYICLSDAKYYDTDYRLRGFMEQNSANIRKGLDLTSNWKECFYNAIKIVKYGIERDVTIDGPMLFIKFMSEIRLKRFVDAEKTLTLLRGSGAKSELTAYADMVYNVEAHRPVAEQVLEGMLPTGELNSFYYVAKHLAQEGKLEEAALVLKWLNGMTVMFLADALSIRIESTMKASEF